LETLKLDFMFLLEKKRS